MKATRYVTMDPTGNRTCLVLDPVPMGDRMNVTAALMDRCEQVGYLMPSGETDRDIRLEMMGGEFCGNASMAAAAFLCGEEGLRPGQEAAVTLEVSGAVKPVHCRIRALAEGAWEGTVEMPSIADLTAETILGERLIAVRMEGMTHLIRRGAVLPQDAAEQLLRRLTEVISAPAVGLLQWVEAERRMIPLVYVRESDTMVWETACGSGSTAIGAWQALQRGEGWTETEVDQPGGSIRVRAEVRAGRIVSVFITGVVRYRGAGELKGE